MRFSLRTLLIVLLLMPPLAAGAWRATAPWRAGEEVDKWTDVGGPGTISEFGAGCILTVENSDPSDPHEEEAAEGSSLETIDVTEEP